MTLDEHVEFCCEMTRLMLWFAAEKSRGKSNALFEDLLQNQTCIARFFIAVPKHAEKWAEYAVPEWRTTFDAFVTTRAVIADVLDAAVCFESRAFEIIRDSVTRRARETYSAESPKPNGALGALFYDPPTPENPRRVTFHISNPLQPRSIFDDPGYLPGCLVELMNDAEKNYGATELFTGTWLNSCPQFLRCFPPEYADYVPLSERYFMSRGFGTWGQFVNARGCFNHKYGGLFRRTGVLPFRPMVAGCSFHALRRHVEQWPRGNTR
jgi:hypothetical protein